MTPTLFVLDHDEIRAREAELLGRTDKSLHELRALAASYELPQEEQAILRRLEELEFLAGRS